MAMRTIRLPRRGKLSPAGILLWYMRALAVYYFVSGLNHWAMIIGLTGDFGAAPTHWQVAHIYFAVVELAAALGLWFGASWGVAAWLFCAVAELVMMNGFTELFGQSWPTTVFHAGTILVYIGLAWWSGSPGNTGEVLRLPED
ncbi:DUF6163 family protein [Lutibaculum baratangense]|uniref:DoxX family protein n=1 Tax=Lutibaculum baratangense AMV1 TaxID=631454 RepID=V4RJ05_9HYPH|nr:DUF6163 family protein [Lutibaculum baratangense]ESR23255.1 hypothetical protein N177_3323 [Lutibaculum baratangense AMV1]